MELLTTRESLRFRLRDLRTSGTIGFVPTMGALHEGHLALIRRAKLENPTVVVSIFVNPTQFNDASDLEQYPRPLQRDVEQCESAGATLVFAPEIDQVYPEGFVTTVTVNGNLTDALEGKFRPGHFNGVTTVVARLFGLVRPDRAYFGEKDWQQLQVIRRMTTDLDLPVEIVPCPTVREPDGLAMSSRNVRLSPEAREQAKLIPYLLGTAQDLLDSATYESQTDKGPVIQAWLTTLVESNRRVGADPVEIDYIAVVDPDTLMGVDEIRDRALVAVALRIGGVRLIDNRLIVRR
ncbi:MAG: pantoate--beta-alanine ligase [Capsulimonadales bacterium]|nr:pantoate--beta-alanine ligase [Capsulimonadales bacterium]